MNLKDISSQLDEALSVLKASGASDDDKGIKLQLLILDLRRQLRLGVFDNLRDLDKISAVNTHQLVSLTSQLKDATDDAVRRNELLDKILGVAKAGFRAAGLPIS